MLSVERCRKILGSDIELTDKEIEQIRDELIRFWEEMID